MPRRKASRRAPSSDSTKNKKKLPNSLIVEKFVEKYNLGQTIPLVDRKTYDELYPPKQRVPPSPAAPEPTPAYPQPNFSFNESYSLPDMAYKPKHYIRFIEPTKEELDAQVEYDMDEEDFAWLEGVNEERVKNGISKISEDDFETLIDRFEKECFFELRSENDDKGLLDINDDEAVCCICGDGEGNSANEILFCEMCNMAVHQECYGVPYIPEGQWLCRRCMYSPSHAATCVLCPSRSGALKLTDQGMWTHVICAIWIPEVQFANPVFLEPIESITKVPYSRWKLSCLICKKRGKGVAIQCMQKKCNTAFHATCAQQAGFYMKFTGRPGEPNTRSNRTVYCLEHSPEMKGDDRFEKLRQKMLKSVTTPIIFEPTLPPERIQEISNCVDFDKKNIFIPRLISYWQLKRRVRFGVPLLRRSVYELKKKENSTHSGEKGAKMTKEEFSALSRLRQDLEKGRLLLELIRKRERIKCELYKTNEKYTMSKLMPIVPYLRKLLDKLKSFDEEDIFDQPVNVEAIPTYSDIVKKPMDFSTILSKIESYEYDCLEAFEKDFNLMIDNCLLFNDRHTYYYKAAIEIRSKAKSIFKEAREELKNMSLLGEGLSSPWANQEPKDLLSPENIKREKSIDSDSSEIKIITKKRTRNQKKNTKQKPKKKDPNKSGESLNKITNDKVKPTIKVEKEDECLIQEEASYSRRIRRTSTVKNESQYSL